MANNPVAIGRKLNAHKTSRTSSGSLKYVQFTSYVYGEDITTASITLPTNIQIPPFGHDKKHFGRFYLFFNPNFNRKLIEPRALQKHEG